MLNSKLKFSKVIVALAARELTELPDFSGSTLRGAFGHSLKKAFCVMHHKECDRCLVHTSCGYYNVFESKNEDRKKVGLEFASHPYIIMAPRKNIYLKNEVLYFHITLFGESIRYLPYFVYSFKLMGEIGLGVDRKKFDLVSIRNYLDGKEILDGERLVSDHFRIYNLDEYSDNHYQYEMVGNGEVVSNLVMNINNKDSIENKSFYIKLITPLRLVENKKILFDIPKETFIQSIKRRYQMLHNLYGEYDRMDLDELDKIEMTPIDLKFKDWSRYSNRQKKKIMQGGLEGVLQCKANTKKNYSILKSLEILQLGRGTAFGLGGILIGN